MAMSVTVVETCMEQVVAEVEEAQGEVGEVEMVEEVVIHLQMVEVVVHLQMELHRVKVRR